MAQNLDKPFAAALLLALAACGPAKPSEVHVAEGAPPVPAVSAAPAIPADKPAIPAPPEAAAGPASSCPFGLEARGSMDVAKGAAVFFYEDRPSLAATGEGAAYAYLDPDSHEAFVVKLDKTGAKKSARKVEFQDKHERSHLVAAFHGGSTALAAQVYHAPQEADIELTMLDAAGRLLWQKRFAPSPLLDGDPAIAWGKDEIAIAWRRGVYPSHNTVLLAFVDPKSGAVTKLYELASGQNPGVPAITWDGDAVWVAWDKDELRGGIQVTRANHDGPLGESVSMPSGANPSILPTPEGLAVAWDSQRAIWFTLLDEKGKPKIAPVAILGQPDPLATPRKPVLAWDGKRFGVAYEVTFHASVMSAGLTQARFALVDPTGAASPSALLHPEASAGEMPAAIFTGKEWLAVFTRGRLQQNSSPMIVSTRLDCRAAPAEAAAAPGPCDARTKDAPEGLRLDPRKFMTAVARTDDGGFVGVTIDRETNKPELLQVDAQGRTKRKELPTNPTPRDPAVAWKKDEFALAWLTSGDDIDIMRFDAGGNQKFAARMNGDNTTRAPGLAYTPKGLVVAYGLGGSIVTEVLDAKNQRPRPAKIAVSPAFPPGDCALGFGPQGLLLAFVTGTQTSESAVIHAARLDDEGLAQGNEAIVTEPHGFLRDPAVLATNQGFFVLGTGPFVREVVGVELGPKGDVVKPERKFLSSYGYAAFGGFSAGGESHVFGLDGKALQERKVCP